MRSHLAGVVDAKSLLGRGCKGVQSPAPRAIETSLITAISGACGLELWLHGSEIWSTLVSDARKLKPCGNIPYVLVPSFPPGGQDGFEILSWKKNTQRNWGGREGVKVESGSWRDGAAPVALAEVLGSIPSTHTALTTIHNYHPRGSVALFWLPCTMPMVHRHTQAKHPSTQTK